MLGLLKFLLMNIRKEFSYLPQKLLKTNEEFDYKETRPSKGLYSRDVCFIASHSATPLGSPIIMSPSIVPRRSLPANRFGAKSRLVTCPYVNLALARNGGVEGLGTRLYLALTGARYWIVSNTVNVAWTKIWWIIVSYLFL